MPWVMMVDSSATTGRPPERAAVTSSEQWISSSMLVSLHVTRRSRHRVAERLGPAAATKLRGDMSGHEGVARTGDPPRLDPGRRGADQPVAGRVHDLAVTVGHHSAARACRQQRQGAIAGRGAGRTGDQTGLLEIDIKGRARMTQQRAQTLRLAG